MTPSKEKVKGYSIQPVPVNEDIWFYVLPKTIEFVVYFDLGAIKKPVQFRVRKSKLKIK